MLRTERIEQIEEEKKASEGRLYRPNSCETVVYGPKGSYTVSAQGRIARVIVTLNCERGCDGCCNKDLDKYKPRYIDHMDDIIREGLPDVVCITGGEPMLDWDKTKSLIKPFYQRRPPTMYLYTARYNTRMEEALHWFDGVHFTLHYPLSKQDLHEFVQFQNLILRYEVPKSYRLYIDSRTSMSIPIIPKAWTRVEVKPWMKECPLPKGETLYVIQ